MVERVLTGCGKEALGDVAPLLTLLRRFATEAAREEARLFCDELVAEAFDDEPQPPPSLPSFRGAAAGRRAPWRKSA
jgi:hypothetical protein